MEVALDRAGIDRGELRTVARRAHDSRVQHSREAHVLHVDAAARQLARNVDPRLRPVPRVRAAWSLDEGNTWISLPGCRTTAQ